MGFADSTYYRRVDKREKKTYSSAVLQITPGDYGEGGKILNAQLYLISKKKNRRGRLRCQASLQSYTPRVNNLSTRV